MAWCFADEASAAIDALLDRTRDVGAIVPALWHWEVANVINGAVRRERLTVADAGVRLNLLAALPIATDAEATARAWRETLALAQAQSLTAYDAAYLELAIRHGIELATSDTALRAAAGRVGVALLP